jgi:cell division protein FtsN
MTSQRGGFVMGLVVGLLVGLALALGVALYITKAPIPFVNKVPQRTAEQDTAEAERNRTWDPNAPLGGKPGRPAASAAVAGASAVAASPPPVAVATPVPAATPPARDPAAILSGAPVPPAPISPPVKPSAEAFVYFVQAGAFTRNEDAEQQRAKLAMMGAMAKITERDQAGRVMYRVRLGPYPSREEADNQMARLQEQNIEAQIVRVEKP